MQSPTVYPSESCLADLIQDNAINNGNTSILNAIHNGTSAIISSTAQGTRDSMEAANRNGIAGIKETGDVGRDNLRETSRVGQDLGFAISESRAAVERTSLEARLSTQVAAAEIREDINSTTRDNLVGIKDNFAAIREEGGKTREHTFRDINIVDRDVLKEGSHGREVTLVEGAKTREREDAHFAKLELQACANKNDIEKTIFGLEKTTLLRFADVEYKALENKTSLAAQIAECCCEQKQEAAQTRALILAQGEKALASKVAHLEMILAVNKIAV